VTAFGIRFVEPAGPGWQDEVYGPMPEPGEWLAEFEPEANDGRGRWRFSGDPGQAIRFQSAFHAFAMWRYRSATVPTRPWDGKPNRPLTACTVVVEALPT
jgi:hypothetical protein